MFFADEHRELPADRNEHLVPARLDQARERLPLAVVLVGVDHVDPEIERPRKLAVTALLPLGIQHPAVFGFHLVGGVAMRPE